MSLPLSAEQQEALRGRAVIVGVTGGIAAYKTCEVVSTLAQAGVDVTVVMTDAATRFVSAMTFEALSGNPVYTSMWEHKESHDPQHIGLARRADAMLIAPCTMDTLAGLAHGFASDPVTLVCSAMDRNRQPVLVAPSMNEVMLAQPSTQRNIDQLREDGLGIIEPGEGWQACRAVGRGRMAEPGELVASLCDALATGARSRA
ncbi:MAG: flavoprotein [Planctomycetota bacterium]|jgi:phosphopantothenoylcysteine decarboxylase/phosphopantothenate--cysteine ligase